MDLILRQNLGVNLVLHDKAAPEIEAVVADIFFRYESDSDKEPVYLGSTPADKSLKVPFDIAQGEEIRFFVVSRTESGEQSVQDPKSGEQSLFNPNLETLVPVIGQLTDATNTAVTIGVNNFTDKAKYRKIEVDDADTFSSPVETIQTATEFANDQLPGTVDITKTGESGTVTKYIRVSHSSNGVTYGTPSDSISVTFADSGGSGGSGGGFDPCFLGTAPFTFYDGGSLPMEYLYNNRARYIGKPLALSFDDDDRQQRGIIDEVFRHEVKEYLIVTFTDGEKHPVTKHHRYYKGDLQYIAIGDVRKESLVNIDGTFACIKSIEEIKLKTPVYVYNARIRIYQNYAVGKKRVHNAKYVDLS